MPDARTNDALTRAQAWLDAFGAPCPLLAPALDANDWTAAHVRRLAELVDHAATFRTGIAVSAPPAWGATDRHAVRRQYLAMQLARHASAVAKAGHLTPDEALGWTAVAAGAEHYRGEVWADGQIAHAADGQPAPVAIWHAAGLAGLAPLAFAGGLTVTEAVQQHATGTLHAETLRALAALRGYRLPGAQPAVAA